MELSSGSILSLPLFLLDDNLAKRDFEMPDLLLEIELDQELLDHLCQNPAEGESVALVVENFEFSPQSEQFAIDKATSQVQLTLTRGPTLAAVLMTEDGTSFVSPQLEMMPTFDLGDEEED